MPSTRHGYEIGQEIEFSGKGTVKDLYSHDSCVAIRDAAGYTHYIYPGSTKVTHEAVAPANWPPKVGDVWKIGSTECFARLHTTADGQVVLVSEDGQNYYRSDFSWLAAKAPKLMRRRGL